MFKKISIGQKMIMAFALLTLAVMSFSIFLIEKLSDTYQGTAKITNIIMPAIRDSARMELELIDARDIQLEMIIHVLKNQRNEFDNNKRSFLLNKESFEKPD